jgi:hypothetical protein
LDLLSTTFQPYKDAMLEYHFVGLDVMNGDLKTAKENVRNSISTI